MKLLEITLPKPQGDELKRRKVLATKIIDLVIQMDQTTTKHKDILTLATQAAGKKLNATQRELEKNEVMRDVRIDMIVKGPLDIVQLNSIVIKMEKILTRK